MHSRTTSSLQQIDGGKTFVEPTAIISGRVEGQENVSTARAGGRVGPSSGGCCCSGRRSSIQKQQRLAQQQRPRLARGSLLFAAARDQALQ